jgi:hypothetical protein
MRKSRLCPDFELFARPVGLYDFFIVGCQFS